MSCHRNGHHHTETVESGDIISGAQQPIENWFTASDMNVECGNMRRMRRSTEKMM